LLCRISSNVLVVVYVPLHCVDRICSNSVSHVLRVRCSHFRPAPAKHLEQSRSQYMSRLEEFIVKLSPSLDYQLQFLGGQVRDAVDVQAFPNSLGLPWAMWLLLECPFVATFYRGLVHQRQDSLWLPQVSRGSCGPPGRAGRLGL